MLGAAASPGYRVPSSRPRARSSDDSDSSDFDDAASQMSTRSRQPAGRPPLPGAAGATGGYGSIPPSPRGMLRRAASNRGNDNSKAGHAVAVGALAAASAAAAAAEHRSVSKEPDQCTEQPGAVDAVDDGAEGGAATAVTAVTVDTSFGTAAEATGQAAAKELKDEFQALALFDEVGKLTFLSMLLPAG